MILSVLRNLRSRPARSALTIAGIAIGVLALVVVGARAERLQTIVSRSTAVNTRSVFALLPPQELAEPGAGVRIGRWLRTIRTFDGVDEVIPEIVLPYAGSSRDTRFGPPSFIFGVPLEARKYAGDLTIDRGRDIAAGERRTAVIGSDFAAARTIRVGDVIALYGNSYTVVGTIAKSFTLYDACVVIGFDDARALLPQMLPPSTPRLPDIPASAALVSVKPGAAPGAIARRISLLTGFRASDPAQIAGSLKSTTRIFDAIIFGAALIALLIGSFSIVNTMTIAVTERTREIGIRKAIGAADADILAEFLAEAAVIGLAGGLIGLVSGAAIALYLDARNAASGNLELFAVTPRLAIGAVLFTVVLSAASGLVPAIRAARLAPTQALRRVA
jgi:putative ABC transport system permease protein